MASGVRIDFKPDSLREQGKKRRLCPGNYGGDARRLRHSVAARRGSGHQVSGTSFLGVLHPPAGMEVFLPALDLGSDCGGHGFAAVRFGDGRESVPALGILLIDQLFRDLAQGEVEMAGVAHLDHAAKIEPDDAVLVEPDQARTALRQRMADDHDRRGAHVQIDLVGGGAAAAGRATAKARARKCFSGRCIAWFIGNSWGVAGKQQFQVGSHIGGRFAMAQQKTQSALGSKT